MTARPPSASPPEHPAASLIRKLLLLLLLAVDVALGVSYLLNHGNPVGYLGGLLFASGALGLVSGFSTRLVLRRRRPGLRALTGFALLTIGLILVGGFTGWKYGLGPLSFQPRPWDRKGLLELAFGSGTLLLALLAWRKAPAAPAPSASEGTAELPARRAAPASRERSQAARRPRTAGARGGKGGRSRGKAAPAASRPKRAGSAPSAPRRRRRTVHFSASGEQRCPYCLDLVEENDPRGVVECQVCHTLHHADCWEITGTCQVPHLNS